MRRNDASARGGAVLRLTLVLLAIAAPLCAAKPDTKEARVGVEGAGLLRNFELRFALKRLLGTESKETLDANAIEDAAVILSSSLGEKGFQEPVVEIEMLLEDGTPKRIRFDPTFENPLPRPLNAREVTFILTPGVRYYIATVEVSGLTLMNPKEARAFFRSDATLFGNARVNAYSPSRVSRAADALLSELRQRGYAEADVRVDRQLDAGTGQVTLRVDVREGPKWLVAQLEYQREEDDDVPLPAHERWIGQPWSSMLQEDIREAIRQAYYRRGFPDMGVYVVAETNGTPAGQRAAKIVATIVAGAPVTVGQVRFEGNARTRDAVLRRRVTLKTGDALDVVALERGRYRISRLGVFEAVDLRYEPGEGTVRDPVFKLREGPRYETSLLAGYGSYEQLRAGVEHRQMNLFGSAHQSRLELVQSMKSTSGDYIYTVPELFGESLDGTARLFGLQRQEISFLRQEYGITLSMKRPVAFVRGSATAGYTFQALRNKENELSSQATDDAQLIVASLNLGLTGDRRDNPLRPRHGYHWLAQVEAADPTLGGEASYQRLELAGAFHTGWGEGRWIHVGLSHGAITTYGSDGATLPVSKRFYPGGDNSIRGYQRGEAAPRGPDGLFIGAKSYLLLNLELEQALTPNWSLVAFGDAIGIAEALRDYPFRDRLYSAGLGVRYQTLIGPVRLEYGRNINPRVGDPSGTLHFSIGYPF